MQATSQDINCLQRLQQIDLDISRLNKQFEELPQRGIILEVREKKASLEAKQTQIAALLRDVNKKLTRATDEDASLSKKEKGVQAAIEAAGDDFRGVEARSKELDGIFKRRATLKDEIESIEQERMKVEDLASKVKAALLSTDKTEQEAVASFRAEGGSIKNDLSNLEKERQDTLDLLSDEVQSAYSKASAHVGSVTVGYLQANKCGVCRTTIESGHLIALKSEAPLGTCPSCGRLLIIEEQDA